MGMFDEIRVKCPACSKEYRAQSKGGDCFLYTYDFPGDGDGENDAPPEVLIHAMTYDDYVCKGCGAKFKIQMITEPRFQVVLCE